MQSVSAVASRTCRRSQPAAAPSMHKECSHSSKHSAPHLVPLYGSSGLKLRVLRLQGAGRAPGSCMAVGHDGKLGQAQELLFIHAKGNRGNSLAAHQPPSCVASSMCRLTDRS